MASAKDTSDNVLTLPTTITIYGSYTIIPLYSNDSELSQYPSLAPRAFTPGTKAIIYMKTEQLKLKVYGSLTIRNLIFDGTENIELYNSPSPNLDRCLTERIFCCVPGQLFEEVACSSPGKYADPLTDPLFTVYPNPDSSNAIFVMDSCKIHNFRAGAQTSWVIVNEPYEKVLIENSVFEKNYFPTGVFYANTGSPDDAVTIRNVNLTNYNYENFMTSYFTYQGALVTTLNDNRFQTIIENVLFDTQYIISNQFSIMLNNGGNLKISNCRFSNLILAPGELTNGIINAPWDSII
jgi:hypothetical protein